ncbi:50S ribosomal protein L10 [candidate division TM6 bacterium RIFCSPHIGHO2_12_FULL_38_8]|nr:MAG: 50S ribosomal protein L10 [candidate division TM6 bacterium RIFCSPHIGHO2_12_FULL_38_8]
MNRLQKEILVQELNTKFDKNAASFVVRCQGMTVAQMHELRLNLAKKDGELKVAKNRLMKLAIVQTSDCANLNAQMRGQTAVVFAKADFTGVAKILNDFAKKNEEFQIVAGCCEAQLFDKAGVARLAMIPSREVLLAQLCGVLNAPIAQFTWVVNQVMQQRSGVEQQPAKQ